MGNARDYSDETARIIDQETEIILRACEKRCEELLSTHRKGLDLVARSLLEHETLDGNEVRRLVELGQADGDASKAEDEAVRVDPLMSGSLGASSATNSED